MSPEQSAALVNRMIEEIQNRKNLDLCDELFSDAFVNHTPPQGISPDRQGMRRLFSMTHAGFPDGRISVRCFRSVDILAVQDDKITEHWSVLDRLDLFRQLGLIEMRPAVR